MCLEVKSGQKAYQKATKQLFDGKEKLEVIFAALGKTSAWKFVGVFYAHVAAELSLFDCGSCSTFAIIGEEEIPKKLPRIEAEIMKAHENWVPEHHIEEFVEVANHLLFIAQGDPFAPVTGSSILDKTIKHVEKAGKAENIILWTLEQLSLVSALPELLYVIIDSFYSTGKTEVLKYYGKYQLNKGLTVHYFNHKPLKLRGSKDLLPFTLMIQAEFPEGVVKETTFQFGLDSVNGFLAKYNIGPEDVLIVDEVICTKYTTQFLNSLIEIKNRVKSFWIAMGAEPLTGKKYRKGNLFCKNYYDQFVCRFFSTIFTIVNFNKYNK